MAGRTAAGIHYVGARVLLSGGSSGIGAATAVALARRGARVALTARRRDGLEEVAGRCRAAGGEAAVFPADFADPAAAADVAAAAAAEFGGLDVVVSNAGLPCRIHARRLDYAAVETTMKVNFLGAAALTLAALPEMLAAGRGHVVAVGSVAARVPAPREAAYVASKHALAAFADCLAVDLAGTGIAVHLVHPGVVATPLWERPGQEAPAVRGRGIPAERVAAAVLAALDSGRYETFVPGRFRLAALFRALAGRAFLAGTALFDRVRAPEAHRR